MYTWGFNEFGMGVGEGEKKVLAPSAVAALGGQYAVGLACGGLHSVVVTRERLPQAPCGICKWCVQLLVPSPSRPLRVLSFAGLNHL